MTKKRTIKRFTADELAARYARGESQSDLAAIRAVTEDELEQDIAGDPDFRDIPRDWYKSAELVMPVIKKSLSLRLDNDVVAWFKAQGPGYQTRMNAALVAFMRASKTHA